jgi:hypothetical protein
MHLSGNTIEFDRRKLPRRPVSGHAMAVFTENNGPGKLTRVELLDASWVGFGVRTSEPVAVGALCSLTPEDAMWPRQVGIVLRCDRDGDGYRVGLQSKLAKAAA